MSDFKKITSVASCLWLIKSKKKTHLEYQRTLNRTVTRLQKSQLEGGLIRQELDEINFLIQELQTNLLELPEGANKNLHTESITALKLRQITLEKRKPYYAIDQYAGAEQAILGYKNLIDNILQYITELEARMIELNQEEEKKKLI